MKKEILQNKLLFIVAISIIALSLLVYQNRFIILNYWHIRAFVNGNFYQIKKSQMYFFDQGSCSLPFLVYHYQIINSDTKYKSALLSLIGALSPQEFYGLVCKYSDENFRILNYYDHKEVLKQLKRSQLIHLYKEYNLSVHKSIMKDTIDKILEDYK